MQRALTLAVVALGFTDLASAQTPTELVSISSSGVQGSHPSHTSWSAGVSDDGRIVAFTSASTTLVAGDLNGLTDVFVRDRLLGTTELASVSSAGGASDGASEHPCASDDGRFIVFTSAATNLVAGDGNALADVFVRDRLNGTTVRVSEPAGGGDADGLSSLASISGDGRFVSFSSTATNLVAGDTNGEHDVFVVELATGAIVRASVDANGAQADGGSFVSRLSDDGSVLVFVSQAGNLWAGDTNLSVDVFVRDMATGAIEAADRTAGGTTPAWGCGFHPALSGDGRFVAFTTSSPDMITPGSGVETFVFERATGAVTLASRNYLGVPSGGSSILASLSDDGRFLAIDSTSRKLVNLDFGPNDDVYVVDRASKEVTRSSMNIGGTNAGGRSIAPTISGDGRWVVFMSNAPDLVAGDANNAYDVFVHDRTQTQPVAFCAAKQSGQGCLPIIVPLGMPSASQPSGFVIEGQGIRNNAPGLLFYGSAPNNVPFQDGTLCVAPPAKRVPVPPAGGTTTCSGRLSLDFNSWMAAGHTPALGAGSLVYAQYWYRDTLSSPYFVGFTDALRFVIYP